jgi:hypothetical protein
MRCTGLLPLALASAAAFVPPCPAVHQHSSTSAAASRPSLQHAHPSKRTLLRQSKLDLDAEYVKQQLAAKAAAYESKRKADAAQSAKSNRDTTAVQALSALPLIPYLNDEVLTLATCNAALLVLLLVGVGSCFCSTKSNFNWMRHLCLLLRALHCDGTLIAHRRLSHPHAHAHAHAHRAW